MEYNKSVSVSGKWVKGGDIKNGVRAKLVAETVRRESQFKNEDGTAKMQDVSKIRFENDTETYNIALNRATIDGLIDAFGTESKGWMSQYLTTQVEKMFVGGRSVKAVYLLPEGYQLGEDENGYMVVQRKPQVAAAVDINYPKDEINPEDIPF
jgi:hypothetical protein